MSLLRDHRFDARVPALALVLASGIFLFLLGIVLQVVAWETKYFFHEIQTTLPPPTSQFVKIFGLRPSSYLFSVTLWFWWPMVVALIYCHFRFSRSREFAVAFAYYMAICWLFVGIGVALIACLLAMPRVILLANLEEPPGFMGWVSLISYTLPVSVALFAGLCWWRFRCR